VKLDTIIAERPNKTVYKDGSIAIKIFNESYSKADVLNEALNLARVEETGLEIPKIYEVTKVGNKWAIRYEHIPGKTVAQLIAENPARKDDLLARFVDIQLHMHSMRVPLLTKLYDKMERKIDQAELNDTTRYDLQTRLASMPKHNKLCHGDFNPSNVIITPKDKAYILDWNHATQGNASADAARTYLIFHLEGDIEGAERYMTLFCEKSGTAKEYVQSWLPIVAASQTVKGKPEERELLLKWVNVVDYE
jgi:tRNA A-37 threonylcarbamoyl transferase component Bud32